MHLTPKERDKLTLLSLGLIAERRKSKGLRLNYPEAVAYITSIALEEAREGKTEKKAFYNFIHDITPIDKRYHIIL